MCHGSGALAAPRGARGERACSGVGSELHFLGPTRSSEPIGSDRPGTANPLPGVGARQLDLPEAQLALVAPDELQLDHRVVHVEQAELGDLEALDPLHRSSLLALALVLFLLTFVVLATAKFMLMKLRQREGS